MSETNIPDKIEDEILEKKEKPSKEKKAPKTLEGKKIKNKYYGGTNIEKLPKVPKKYLEDIRNVEPLSPEDLEKYYTAVILGLLPDRFGLETSMETKLKAVKGLTELREAKLREQTVANEAEQEIFACDFVLKQKQQADDLFDTPTEIESSEDGEEDGM